MVDEIDQTKRKRWNRRSSDGAAWNSDSDSTEVDDDPQQQHTSSLCSSLRRILASEPLLQREPIQITEEFKDRVAAAGRASTVTFTTFFILIFSGQEYLPVAWIGNVFALSTLKSTLGGTILSTKDVFIPMLPVAMGSWGVVILLGMLTTKLYSILLPFVVMTGCLLIILCPWPFLTMKNLMLLVFYLIVASPLSLRYSGFENDAIIKDDVGDWFVPGLVGTCTIGLCVAVFVHVALLPFPKRSTTASRLAPKLVAQLSDQSNQLLSSVSEYIQNIGKGSSRARQSRTLIEYYVKSMSKTLKKLEMYLPAMRTEIKNFKLSTKENLDTVEEFVKYSKKQQKHAELIRLATTQQFLGEEFTSLNDTVRDVKSKISNNLAFAVEQVAKEYRRSEHALYFEKMDANKRNDIFQDLQHCMRYYRKAMRQAIADAEALLLNDDDASRSTAGPLIRQRVAFMGIFSFVHELLDTIARLDNERPAVNEPKSMLSRLKSTLKTPWLWHDLGKRRLAMKTAIGLGLASLWVSIPYLRGHVAYPNSIWVGVTVASVSLDTTGAAYIKSLDRLFGTLVAAGYALLIGKVLEDSNVIAKLIALSIFTFGATLLTNYDRPYASRYAATSVGSILFGSFDNGISVNQYVPVRIMLIFTGVVTFLFVEMLLLPRSSRTIVQAQSLQFFEDLENFMFESSRVCGSIASIQCNSSNAEEQNILLADDPTWMLREGYEKVSLTEDLSKSADVVKETTALAKRELIPGRAEPSVGLNGSLDAVGFENLLMEQNMIASQLDLLITTIKCLVGYFTFTTLPEDHPVRSLHWPTLLSASLMRMAQQLSECADKLRSVFPNGLCRPGVCDISDVIGAIAHFRNFDDAILAILSDVSDGHAHYLGSKGEAPYAPGLRLTLALAISAILTIGQSLTNCGKHLETIVQSFPIENVRLMKTPQRIRASINMGDDDDDSSDI